NGDGTFQPHVDYPTGTADSLAVADFNGDGKLDVASVSPGGGVSIFLGNGDGTLQPPVGYPAGDGAEGIAVADFNGDGKVDLLVGHLGGINTPGPNVTILLANGDGTFQAPQSYGVGYNPKAVAAADVNGDGHIVVIDANAGTCRRSLSTGTTLTVLFSWW